MRQNDRQTSFARAMRQSPTEAERALWLALRDRRLCGHKFRRQVPFGPFIVDFHCADARLIVEADGSQHGDAADMARDAWLRAQGQTVLHFWNTDILTNLPGVLDTILAAIAEATP
ncbi:endonuclease domain-containing protein [Fuscibacter oryzae]|uniref:Endonuclease domain-containing protein n=1 Tax=Fuscibacter oryzae TaxID=2803939 RepID=A0A8J7MS08_9RHOB|nr:endonuclease domain-containing protein [Fuscibacter oryzae]MBL4929253.1 endonuclease domain-containing protein [Fuscibacter oryzae]